MSRLNVYLSNLIILSSSKNFAKYICLVLYLNIFNFPYALPSNWLVLGYAIDYTSYLNLILKTKIKNKKKLNLFNSKKRY